MIEKLLVWTLAVMINAGALYYCVQMGKFTGWKKLWLIFLIMPLVAMVFRIFAIANLYSPNDALLFYMNYIAPIVFSIACLFYVRYTHKILKHHFGNPNN